MKQKNRQDSFLKIIAIFAVVLAVSAGMLFFILFQSREKARKYDGYLQLGQKYLSEMKYEDAILAFQEAVRLDPKRAEAYTELAELYINNGQYDKAEEMLRYAENHAAADVQYNILMEQKKVAEAKGQAKRNRPSVTPVPASSVTADPTPRPTVTPKPTATPAPTATPEPSVLPMKEEDFEPMAEILGLLITCDTYTRDGSYWTYEKGSISADEYRDFVSSYMYQMYLHDDPDTDEFFYFSCSVSKIEDIVTSLFGWLPPEPSESDYFYRSGKYYYLEAGDGEALRWMEMTASETKGNQIIVYADQYWSVKNPIYDGSYRLVFEEDTGSRFGYRLISIEGDY